MERIHHRGTARRSRNQKGSGVKVEQAFPVRHSLGDGGCLFNSRVKAPPSSIQQPRCFGIATAAATCPVENS